MIEITKCLSQIIPKDYIFPIGYKYVQLAKKYISAKMKQLQAALYVILKIL